MSGIGLSARQPQRVDPNIYLITGSMVVTLAGLAGAGSVNLEADLRALRDGGSHLLHRLGRLGRVLEGLLESGALGGGRTKGFGADMEIHVGTEAFTLMS